MASRTAAARGQRSRQNAKPTGHPASPRGSQDAWWWGVLLAIIVLLAYANSLDGSFFVDDLATITDNAAIHDWHHLRDLLASPEETPLTSRPVVALTFAVNYTLAGESVFGYHIVNIAIHLAVVLLLFGVMRELLARSRLRSLVGPRSTAIAFAIAALWGVHPLNTEAVDYVTQRTETLMGLFYLATIFAILRAISRSTGRRTAIAILCCSAGMACKESMVTAPLAVLLVDSVFVSESLTVALRARWRLYLGLAADVWPKASVVIVLLAATIIGLWRRPTLGFVGAWFFQTLAPTSSVMPIATEVGAERRMYVPLMALVAMAVLGSVVLRDHLTARRISSLAYTPAVAWSALTVLLVLLISGTALRNREYRSALTLAQSTVDRWPSSVAEHVLGTELMFAGNKIEARRHFQRALTGAPRAYYSLALVGFDDGEWGSAIQDFERFVKAQPRLLEARFARLYLAQALEHESRWPEAIEQCRLVLSMNPTREDTLDAQLFWADALRGEGKY